MFDRLNEAFSGLFRRLSGKDKISERNVAEAMADVRSSLIDADVHIDVVDRFCERVLADALGANVTKSLEPGQEMIGIVHKRLVEFLGGEASMTEEDLRTGLPIPLPKIAKEELIDRTPGGVTTVMMTGLQGSGKTTTCGKLAAYLKKRGRTVLLAACDLQRPAAVEQLRTIAEQVEREVAGGGKVHFYAEPDKCAEYGKAVGVAVEVAWRALERARSLGVDTLILDTAGRLHVNEALMEELAEVRRRTDPRHVLLVVDAMTGQDAVVSSRAFHERLRVGGVILSKFDSDARGGAALSVKHVTGAPIKFLGVGEKLEALEEFHADRVAGRMLGMGDVLSLVEKAQSEVSDDDAKALQEKMAKGEMTMDDFLKQLRQLRRMGPLKQLLGLLPGVGSMLKGVDLDDKQFDKVEAIIQSMTKHERRTPGVITFQRRRRIAAGSGTRDEDVGRLVKQFDMMQRMTKDMANMSLRERAAAARQMGPAALPGGPMPAGNPWGARGSTASKSIKDKFKKRR
jgi:signal recognition particle subunit SRP54